MMQTKKITGAVLFVLVLVLPMAGQDEVRINVDAAVKEGPYPPVWAFFGYDEPNYTYMKDGRKLLSELGGAEPGSSAGARAQSADLGRWRSRVEVGLDERVHRGRERKPSLRLDDRGPHLRHVRGTER
jgi:hypothetical protein